MKRKKNLMEGVHNFLVGFNFFVLFYFNFGGVQNVFFKEIQNQFLVGGNFLISFIFAIVFEGAQTNV